MSARAYRPFGYAAKEHNELPPRQWTRYCGRRNCVATADDVVSSAANPEIIFEILFILVTVVGNVGAIKARIN